MENIQYSKKKGHGTMKKSMKFILVLMAATFIIIIALWGSFAYVSNYRVTDKEKHTEAGNANKTEGINSQAV